MAAVGWETNELRSEMTRLNDRLARTWETLARMEVTRENTPRWGCMRLPACRCPWWGGQDRRSGPAFRSGAQAVEDDGDASGAVRVVGCRVGVQGEDGGGDRVNVREVDVAADGAFGLGVVEQERELGVHLPAGGLHVLVAGFLEYRGQ